MIGVTVLPWLPLASASEEAADIALAQRAVPTIFGGGRLNSSSVSPTSFMTVQARGFLMLTCLRTTLPSRPIPTTITDRIDLSAVADAFGYKDPEGVEHGRQLAPGSATQLRDVVEDGMKNGQGCRRDIHIDSVILSFLNGWMNQVAVFA
jgi:hypothetical protein